MSAELRLAVYTDYTYHAVDGGVHADRAFALFLSRLAQSVDRLTIVGRLAPTSARARYPLGEGVRFVALPWYESLARPRKVVRTLVVSLRRFWRALGDVDCVWLLGPHPIAIGFALLALARRRRVVLGVRQDLIAYIRNRHPGRWSFAIAGIVMEGAFRALALVCPTIVVGPDLRRRYRHSRALLEIAVSLIDEGDLVAPEVAIQRPYDGELRLLSVGRLEAEKNPLLLADILAGLNTRGGRWRLTVCGEGALRDELAARLRELGVADRAELRGYVPLGAELFGLYRDAHAMVHVSWTEGFPGVLLEAFATGTPVVATDVGGVLAGAGDAVVPVPPGDASAAASAVRAVASDPEMRRRLIRAGHAYVAAHTANREIARVASFLDSGPASDRPTRG